MSKRDDKLAELQRICDEQDERSRQADARHAKAIAAIEDKPATLDEVDGGDRMELLDRLADRMPDLDLDQHEIEWKTLPDGGEALVVDGGGFDGGPGWFFVNAPDDSDDIHAVGPTAPLAPGKIGCVLIHGDGTRELARLIDDPLADQDADE